MKLSVIADHLRGQLIGDGQKDITSVASLQDALQSDITFVLEKKYYRQALEASAGAFVTYAPLAAEDGRTPDQIVVKNPRKAMAQLIALLYPEPALPQTSRIAPSAVIHETARIGTGCVIDPGVLIGQHTLIGNGVIIRANTVIGDHCAVGDQSLIGPNVVIYDKCRIGCQVTIQAGVVIGSDGFGFFQDNGEWRHIPHIGGVLIEDNVHIGANTVVAQGCLGPTVIGKGTKIDNLVQVAHNVVMGEHCLITGQVGFLGSAKLGNYVVMGGQSGVGAIEVGDHTMIAARGGVTKSLPEKSVVSGYPAVSHKEELENQAILRRIIKEYRERGKS